jgi:signal peptidase
MVKNEIRKIIKITAVVIIVALAGLIFLTIAPEAGGYKALVVTSGSMETAVPAGSIVFINNSGAIQKNDIITFRMGPGPKLLTTHRVVDIRETRGTVMYQTKGDAVKEPDIELVPAERVAGKVVFSVPFVGYPVAFAKTQMGVIMLVVIPAAIIVYEELKSIWREVAVLRRKVKKLEGKEDKPK